MKLLNKKWSECFYDSSWSYWENFCSVTLLWRQFIPQKLKKFAKDFISQEDQSPQQPHRVSGDFNGPGCRTDMRGTQGNQPDLSMSIIKSTTHF